MEDIESVKKLADRVSALEELLSSMRDAPSVETLRGAVLYQRLIPAVRESHGDVSADEWYASLVDAPGQYGRMSPEQDLSLSRGICGAAIFDPGIRIRFPFGMGATRRYALLGGSFYGVKPANELELKQVVGAVSSIVDGLLQRLGWVVKHPGEARIPETILSKVRKEPAAPGQGLPDLAIRVSALERELDRIISGSVSPVGGWTASQVVNFWSMRRRAEATVGEASTCWYAYTVEGLGDEGQRLSWVRGGPNGLRISLKQIRRNEDRWEVSLCDCSIALYSGSAEEVTAVVPAIMRAVDEVVLVCGGVIGDHSQVWTGPGQRLQPGYKIQMDDRWVKILLPGLDGVRGVAEVSPTGSWRVFGCDADDLGLRGPANSALPWAAGEASSLEEGQQRADEQLMALYERRDLPG